MLCLKIVFNIQAYDQTTGTLRTYEDWFLKPMEFEGLLSYKSYHGTGLYAYDDMKKRHEWIFNEEKWDTIQLANSKVLVPDKSDMKGVQSGKLNILDAVDTNDLMGIVFGNYMMQFCKTFLSELGYLDGLEFLVRKLSYSSQTQYP